MADTEVRSTRKERQGIVVSDVQDKTVVVRVDRTTTHPLYAKTLRVSKKYHVHDEANDAHVGDTVSIVETRPISKLKRWRLAEVIERAK
ncbi:MAG: 30S ribosomal protein S17 [Nitriliruptoraceae bacterium]